MTQGNDAEQTAHQVIGAAIEVHRHLGPGLLERVYEEALFRECQARGIEVERQVSLPVRYKGETLPGCEFRVDLLAGGRVVIELKSVRKIEPVHLAQTLTYLKLGEFRLGLILNFNCYKLGHGIKRVVNGWDEEADHCNEVEPNPWQKSQG